MQSLTMNIERRWFKAIVDGTKKIEYRDMSPYWMRRIDPLTTPFRLRLLNGMTPPVPEAVVEVTKVVRSQADQQFQLHLGKVLRVTHWDRRLGEPRT